MPPFDPNYVDPEVEDFEPNEWKALIMLLCENRGGLDLDAGLTDYGKTLLVSLQRKIGIIVVGVASGVMQPVEPEICSTCFSPVVYGPAKGTM